MRYAFVLDQSRCIGCHACSLACKAEHDVPLGSYRTWVKYVEKGSFPDVRRHFSVLRCNHCDRPPCVEICPVTALYRRDDGIVDFDRDVCIGCKACMQACPYDALYIHPERGTAEKCNFCAHRVEVGLEPPCATVCPAEAILVGDMDDPASRLSRILAGEPVSVRKPEKGTRPKVFYIEGEPRALTPGASDASGGYMWADRQPGSGPALPTVRASSPAASPAGGASPGSASSPGVPGPSASPVATGPAPRRPGAPDPTYSGGRESGDGATPPGARRGAAAWMGTDLPPAAAAQALAASAARGEADFFSGVWAGLAPARTVYDVGHQANPWGSKVSAYLWTKSVAAGALIVAALAPWLGLTGDTVTVGAPLVGLVFLALTGVLLVVDLKRPERFWTILTRPNWDSWLARGAFIITAFGLLAAAWAGAAAARMAGIEVPDLAFVLLRWPLVAAAAATAGYSGFLFAQARGRDFWQSPLLPAHLVVQAVGAGAAALAPLALVEADTAGTVGSLLVAALAVHLALVFFGEIAVPHATSDAAHGARALTRGRYRGWFWTGIGLTAGAAALVAVAGLPSMAVAATAGAAALAGLAAYEHAWNLAGQSAPLS